MKKEKEISISKVQLQSPNLKVMYHEFDKLVRSKNLAVIGTGAYQLCVKEFFLWLELQGITKLKRVKTSDMIDYYEYLTTRPKKRGPGTLSESMVSQHLYSLRLLFDYLLETKQIESAVLLPKNNQGTKKERNVATEEEITLMYKHCINKRERAILSIAYGCGLRRIEVERLNTNDINFSNGMLSVRKGKNRKLRDVPMSETIIKHLKDYLVNERPKYLKEQNKLELSFLVNNKGKRMKGDHANDCLKEIIIRTKNQKLIRKEITLHCLRHSIATHLIDNGADIEFVRNFLGHVQIDTSHIYSRKRKSRMSALIHQ